MNASLLTRSCGIHFMGHGRFDPVEGEAALAFTDLRGGSDWVSDRALAELISRQGTTPRAVVLHACEGGKPTFLSASLG